MSIDPDKYNRAKLEELAIELGVDEAEAKAAETKKDVVALIDALDQPQGGGDDPAPDPASDPDPVAPEPRSNGGPVFIVNGRRVDFSGKPVKE